MHPPLKCRAAVDVCMLSVSSEFSMRRQLWEQTSTAGSWTRPRDCHLHACPLSGMRRHELTCHHHLRLSVSSDGRMACDGLATSSLRENPTVPWLLFTSVSGYISGIDSCERYPKLRVVYRSTPPVVKQPVSHSSRRCYPSQRRHGGGFAVGFVACPLEGTAVDDTHGHWLRSTRFSVLVVACLFLPFPP